MTQQEKPDALEIIRRFVNDMSELTGEYPNEIKLSSTSYDILAHEINKLFEKNWKPAIDVNSFILFGTNIKKVGFIK